MNKQPEITDRTRQTFVDAFCMLYTQKPIEKISIQEIAKKAGYNRSTFYQYFLDIDDLLNYTENELIEYICQKREKGIMNDQLFVTHLIDVYSEKSTYIDALLGDFGSNLFLEDLKTKMQSNIYELSLPDSNPLKPYLVEFHLSSTLSLFRLWLRRKKDLPLDEFLSLVSDLYMGGLSSVLT